MCARPGVLPLPAREAYRLWAETYDVENAVTVLEQRCVGELTPPLADLSLLDVACGTGRRLPHAGGRGPRQVVGVDLVHEMIRRARFDGSRAAAAARRVQGGASTVPKSRPSTATAAARRVGRGVPWTLAVADVRRLPFARRLFDVIWFRLAAGHLPDLDGVYRELGRVARSGAHVIVTDFHPAAAWAGHVRSFRDARGRLHVVEHHIHDLGAHVDAAARAGLAIGRTAEFCVGPEIRPFYLAAGRQDAYERQRALPLVLALVFRA